MSEDLAKKARQAQILIEGNSLFYVAIRSDDEWVYFDHYVNENGKPVGTKRIAQSTLTVMDVGMATLLLLNTPMDAAP